MLNCMEGRLTDLTVTRVRESRASNKVFGLSDPERWSEHKQLVDFVDDIFSSQRRHVVKFMKPVSHVKQSSDQLADIRSTHTLRTRAGIRRRWCRWPSSLASSASHCGTPPSDAFVVLVYRGVGFSWRYWT